MKRLVTSAAALGLLAAGSVASACTLDAWSSRSGTTPVVGGPGDTVELARYSGVCAMQADSGTQFVQDNSPASEGTLIARFYFLAAGSGDTTIYQAFSDDGASGNVFSISADGSNVTVTPASGSPISASMGPGWNGVEVSYTNSGNISLWVNADSTTDTASASGTDGGSGTVEAIQLGAVTGLGGFTSINFDDYESRRTTPIGLLVPGDADSSGGIDVIDLQGIVDEILARGPSTGVPDCTGDGLVDVQDIQCVVDVILNR